MPIVSLLFHDVYLRRPSESGFDSPGADRYKLSLAELDAQLNALAGVCADEPLLAADCDGATLELGATPAGERLPPLDRTAMPFLITVDDGGVSYYTVLGDRLEALGWRGHCFVTTDRIGEPGFLTAPQIRELDARGHVIGSHSASHPTRFSACGPDRMRREWRQSRMALEDALGHAVAVASVPGGYFSPTVARTAAEAGIRVLFTSEPTTTPSTRHGCVTAGRFTVRPGCRHDFCNRIVLPPAHARRTEWAGWNAKKVVKPLLGSTYARVADWLLAPRS